MTIQRTDLGRELEEALGEVLAHVRGTTPLPCRIVDDPAAEHIVALRKRMKLSRQKFADSFGLDVRALQEWEQGRRVPGPGGPGAAHSHRPRTRGGATRSRQVSDPLPRLTRRVLLKVLRAAQGAICISRSASEAGLNSSRSNFSRISRSSVFSWSFTMIAFFR